MKNNFVDDQMHMELHNVMLNKSGNIVKGNGKTIFHFRVPGHPVGKGIPGQTLKGFTYTKPHIRNYLVWIRHCFVSAYPGVVLDDRNHQWHVVLNVQFKGRCDNDKIENSFFDALQSPRSHKGKLGNLTRGLVWHDDTQVYENHTTKERVKNNEGVIVWIEQLGEITWPCQLEIK